MYIVGLQNSTAQSVLENGLINLGTTYRSFYKPNGKGVLPFTSTSNSVTLVQEGIYKITFDVEVSAPAAGNVTLAIYENGVLVPFTEKGETITTADTEIRSFSVSYLVLVTADTLLCSNVTTPKTITLVNTGIASTINNIITSVKKVVY